MSRGLLKLSSFTGVAILVFYPYRRNKLTNAWKYYFEPISNLKLEKGDKIYSFLKHLMDQGGSFLMKYTTIYPAEL